MEKIINYLEIPAEKRDSVLERLLSLGFCPAYGKLPTMKREMEKTQRDKLPQFLFVFREDALIGFLFLIAEKEHTCKAFPWWAVSNSDELHLETAIRLLEHGIQLSIKCGCPTLADRLNSNLEAQKKGLARRPESACR